MKKYYTIYQIRNDINGMIYVGQHITSNLYDNYMGSGVRLHEAYEYFGIENFSKEILHVFDNAEEMFQMEKDIVDIEFIKRADTYNVALGGTKGWHTVNKAGLNGTAKGVEARLKLHKDPDWNSNFKDSIRSGQTLDGRNKGVSKRKKTMLERYGDDKSVYQTFLGKNHTEESRKLMSRKRKGKGQGSDNSQYGTTMIHHASLQKTTRIKWHQYESYLSQGWELGAVFNWSRESQLKEKSSAKEKIKQHELEAKKEEALLLYKRYCDSDYISLNKFCEKELEITRFAFMKKMSKYLDFFDKIKGTSPLKKIL